MLSTSAARIRLAIFAFEARLQPVELRPTGIEHVDLHLVLVTITSTLARTIWTAASSMSEGDGLHEGDGDEDDLDDDGVGDGLRHDPAHRLPDR